MSDATLFAGAPVCIVGNVNRDVKVTGVPSSPALLQDGETSVAAIAETIGGGGANSACAAVALGGRVRFMGKVGADLLGQRLQAALERHGVETHLAKDAVSATGTTAALGFQNGHRHFLSCLPNNRSLRFEDLDLSTLDGCSHLLRADVWFSEAMLEQGNVRLFKEARQRQIPVSLDLNFDPWWSTGSKEGIARRKQLLRQALAFVDLAHGNIRELCEFTDTSEVEAALQRLSAWGVKAVVVHLGGRGAGFWEDGTLVVEAPVPARQIINSTGSGDVLSICMILLHGRNDLSIHQKLKISNQIVSEFMEGRRVLIPSL